MRWPEARRRPRPRRSRDASSSEPPLSFLVEGPWSHQEVVANGFSFHVAVGEHHDELRAAAQRPPVLLLHGFAQFWWAWRHQLPALDLAGHPVAAMDLRGYGASDQPPRGYDPATLARDVAGVIRGLGHRRAHVVGHDLGGAVGWATAAFVPEVLAGLVSVAAPAPGATRPVSRPGRWLPARSWSARSGSRVERYLRSATAHPADLDVGPAHTGDPEEAAGVRAGDDGEAGSDGSGGRTGSDRSADSHDDGLACYRRALVDWPAPQRALAAVRHSDRPVRRILESRPADIDLLSVRGALDRVVGRAAMARGDRFVAGQHTSVELADVGHLPAEEDPQALSAALLSWLAPR